MYKSILVAVAVLTLLLSGSLTAQDSETRSLDAFHGISVGSSVDAELRKGSKNEVKIKVQGIELDKVTTEIENGILKVGIENNSSKNWKKKKVHVVVTYSSDPDFVSAHSSADVIAHDVIKADKMVVKASSSADLQIEVNAGSLSIDASSSADIEISGSADDADIKASSSADIIGGDLTIQNVTVKASSSADIDFRVEKSLKARASSSADITYYGNPERKDIERNSGADVSRGGN